MIGSEGLQAIFGISRFVNFPRLSWLSAHNTSPSIHLNPATIVTAFLSGSRSGLRLGRGLLEGQ